MQKEIIKNGLLTLLKYFKGKDDWKDLFTACKEALKGFDLRERIPTDEEVSRIFETEEYKAIEKQIKSGKIINLHSFINKKFIELFVSYDYEEGLAKKYTQIIQDKLLLELRLKFPIEYNMYKLDSIDESIHEVLGNQKEIISAIDKIPEKTAGILNHDTIKKGIRTIDDINMELKHITSPQIDLSFFNFNDEDFKTSLLKSLDKKLDVIHIQGNSKEETLYAVLYELIANDCIRNDVFIVNNYNTWEQLSGMVYDQILIPNFYAEEIKPIKNNTSIFIYSVDKYSRRDNVITLRPRLSADLYRLLFDMYKGAGLQTSEVQKLIDQTQGKFSAIKRKLFNSQYQGPAWLSDKSRYNANLHKALLLGSWNDLDAQLIQDFLDPIPYDQFIRDLAPYMNGEDPFLIKLSKSYFTDEGYKVTSPEEAWGYLGKNIDNQLWLKFKALCLEILPYDPNTDGLLYSDKQDMSLYQSPVQPKGSTLLRKGLSNNLIECKDCCLENQDQHQNFVSEIVRKVLESIEDRHSWCYFLNHSHAFAEASPTLVLQRIELEISRGRKSPLVQLFETSVYIGWNQPVNYIHILSTITLYFSFQDCITRAVRCLCQLNDLKLVLPFSNSPKQSLRYIFCPWYHDNLLSADEIKILAEMVVMNFSTGWDIIAQELPHSPSDMIFGTPPKPIRKYLRDNPKITTRNLNDIYQFYTQLCVEYADKDVARWLYLLERPDIFHFDCNKTLDALTQMLESSTDAIKDKIKNNLRILLHKHRKFKNAIWALPENILSMIEVVHEAIKFEKPEFEYAHLFDKYLGKIDIDINPEPWNENKTDYTESMKREENDVISKMYDFSDKNHDLRKLLEISSFEGGDIHLFGRALATAYSHKGIDEELFSILTSVKPEKNLLLYYIIGVYDLSGRKNEVILDAIKIAKKIKIPSDLIVKIAQINYYTLPNKDLLSILSHEEILQFWNTFPIQIVYFLNEKNFDELIEKCLEFQNKELFWRLVENSCTKLGNEICISLLEKAKNNHISAEYSTLLVKNIFKQIYLDSNFKKSNRDRIANLEFYFLLDEAFEKGTCILSILKEDPSYYAQAVDILFMHDDGNKGDKDPNNFGNLYTAFNKMKFCPGEEDSSVNPVILNDWVDGFRNLLDKQQQISLFAPLLGSLLAHSPIGEDGCEPHKSVRELIEKLSEELEESEKIELSSSYINAKKNMRGGWIDSAGEEERAISIRYKSNAEHISIIYPYTAKIYYQLAQYYSSAALEARKRAEQHS